MIVPSNKSVGVEYIPMLKSADKPLTMAFIHSSIYMQVLITQHTS